MNRHKAYQPNRMYSDHRNKEETSRAGEKWSSEENEKLTQEINEKKSFEDIALEHKRTVGGIKSRVVTLFIQPRYKSGMNTLEELALEYGIDEDTVNKYIHKDGDNNPKTTSTKPRGKETLTVRIEKLEDHIVSLQQKIEYLMDIVDKKHE